MQCAKPGRPQGSPLQRAMLEDAAWMPGWNCIEPLESSHYAASITSRAEGVVRQRIATLSIIALLCAASSVALGQSADIVAVNGKVFTARDGAGFAQGFAIKGEKFIAVGSTEAMRAHAGANTTVIDLGGRFVTPG